MSLRWVTATAVVSGMVLGGAALVSVLGPAVIIPVVGLWQATQRQ